MSNSGPSQALQSPKVSAARFWPLGQDCLLCGAAARDSAICAACDEALPRIGAACARCAVPLERASLCGECLRRPPHFDAALAVFEYRFPLDRLLQRFKYSADLAVGDWLALQLAARVNDAARPDLVVAVPLTARRLRRRGFNQAMELARVVAKRIGVRRSIDALARVRDTEPQPGLGRSARRANLRGAFRCDAQVDGEHVALVDDVVTTGATADAIAGALKAAGAARVSLWSVARTPDPRNG
jgi:ComF family protein